MLEKVTAYQCWWDLHTRSATGTATKVIGMGTEHRKTQLYHSNIQQRHLHIHAYYDTIHNNQEVEPAKMSWAMNE